MFPLRQLPWERVPADWLSSPQLWLLRNCSHLSLVGKGSGLFKACFLGTWRAGNWASMRRWSCRVSSHGPCSVTALLREKLQFWFPKAQDSCYSNWLVPFPRLPPVLHPGTKGHGQSCGGSVTVRCGSRAPSLAAAYGAAEVGLGSVSREDRGWGPGVVGIWCWEGRPSKGFGRPGGEGVASGHFQAPWIAFLHWSIAGPFQGCAHWRWVVLPCVCNCK